MPSMLATSGLLESTARVPTLAVAFALYLNPRVRPYSLVCFPSSESFSELWGNFFPSVASR